MIGLPACSACWSVGSSRSPARWSVDPRLVLLDEPGAGLAEADAKRLVPLIQALADPPDTVVMLVDHDMDLVQDVCRDLAVLDFGRLIAYGPTAERPRRPGGQARLLGHGGRRMSTETKDMSLADALVVDGLTVARGGRDVLRDVSLTVPRGEITTLLGPNGAGKSSLVLALAGLIPARAGTIRIGTTDLGGLDPEQVRAHGVAIVPEGHRVLRSLSVSDNLRVAAVRMTREEEAAGRERVLALLPELDALLERPAGKLSGGQQQMLAIAQAVIDPPDFLIIDELSLGLAPVVVRRLVPTLSQVAAAGVGVLLIEQFTTIALSVASTAGCSCAAGCGSWSRPPYCETTRTACIARTWPATAPDSAHARAPW